MPNSRRIIVIVRHRPFDETAWKRLLVAYAYALYDKNKHSTQQAITTAGAQHK